METTRWLTSLEARDLIAAFTPYDDAAALRSSDSLRSRGLTAEQTTAVLTQARLRTRAAAKFGAEASQLLFTPNGYEQSTRWSVAQSHAARFAAAGARSITDLGCGIGSDSRAFAQAGLTVTSIESDPMTTILAQANIPAATVICADGRDIDLPATDAIWLDPARRTSNGRRITNPEHWSPAFSEALAITYPYRYAGIKVAPGIAHEILPSDASVVWTSEHGELLEAVVWRGCGEPGRFAVVDGTTYDAGAARPNETVAYVDPTPLRSLVLEPDSALIRAGAIETLCADGAAPISSGIAYLTADEAIPGCAAFSVIDVVGNKPKAIAAALREHGLAASEIKKRGTDTDITALAKALKKIGGRPGVVILSPVLGKHKAILAERL